MGDLFDQDHNPEIFGPPPMWARHLDRRVARRFAAIHQQILELKEMIVPTLDDLNAAVAAVTQKVTDLDTRIKEQAANPIPQSAVDAVNSIGTQLDAIDPTPVAPAPAVDPNAPPTA